MRQMPAKSSLSGQPSQPPQNEMPHYALACPFLSFQNGENLKRVFACAVNDEKG